MSKVKVPRFLAVIWWFLAVICRFSKSLILKRCLCCICLCLCHCLCLFVGMDMSTHPSDQMSQRSQVSKSQILKRCLCCLCLCVCHCLCLFVGQDIALGDRYRKFYQTLNNAKKPFNSIFNSKKFQPYSFKILFI